jgi:ABC-type taurine transport system substrate-binding protein
MTAVAFVSNHNVGSTAFISGPATRAIGRAGVAVDRVWLASYGAIADHLCVGTSRGGVDAGIMPAGAAERLPGGSEIILLSRLAGGRSSVLVAREGFQADQHGRARLALSSPAHFDILRRHWPAPTVQQVVLPAPQIALNLRAGMIDLALLSEAAVRPILERGLVRIVTRLPEPELEAALVLRKDWAAVHRSVALALREALASARLAS